MKTKKTMPKSKTVGVSLVADTTEFRSQLRTIRGRLNLLRSIEKRLISVFIGQFSIETGQIEHVERTVKVRGLRMAGPKFDACMRTLDALDLDAADEILRSAKVKAIPPKRLQPFGSRE